MTSRELNARRAVGYCRVSTKAQAASGLSLGEQEAEIGRLCERKGFDLIDMRIEPGASGRSGRRPVLQKLVQDAASAQRTFDVVVFLNFSRFFRNLFESEFYRAKFLRHGVEMVSAT